MIRKTLLLAAVPAFTIAAAQPATKPSPAPTSKPTPAPSTLNCLLASNVFAHRETDPKKRELAHETLLFYLGRVDPRTNAAQLKVALKQTAERLQGVNAASLMNECLIELRAKGTALEAAAQQPAK